ncbi:hypothetical protein H8S20_15475 [Clostridium sp. NSJ-6]|uniref:Uncharacterized protein n=1 Tax=Clostridium hominis TaxID=2763036 RepID=A0ABR7DFV5_9CLOT|nr:hypothetical protein [Clostridium hominis]MBC5630261.1 hypothetical protein [Clostridium hominis]
MSLYKVTTTFALVMDKPKILSNLLGILIKDNIIEVINFYDNWAYFKYKDQDAYTHSYNLAELSKEDLLKNDESDKDDELCGLSPSMISKDIYCDNNKK